MKTLLENEKVFVQNGYISVPTPKSVSVPTNVEIATVMSNLAAYGYTLDQTAYRIVSLHDDIVGWWKQTEKVLKAVTGADRNMGDHIVYKNFPKECLEMSEADWVIRQILIYWGMPYHMLREPEEAREPLGDMKRLKVLSLATEDTPGHIFASLVRMPNRWSDNQTEWAAKFLGSRNAIVMADFGFKENGITLAASNYDKVEFEPSSATDVLRLVAGISGGDISLRETVRIRKLKRPDRRRLLSYLERQENLAEDMAVRPEIWKRLMERLRPGDYAKAFPRVCAAYDGLYRRAVKPISALLDPQVPTESMLAVAAQRPGEFVRRFHHFYGLFREDAVRSVVTVFDRLTMKQLVSFRRYLETIGTRFTLMYPPRSNWSKVQVAKNSKVQIDPLHVEQLVGAINQELRSRLTARFPEGVRLDPRMAGVKLQTNDQKLAEYGRGTEFDIPENITFIRSASYWQMDRSVGVTWFDNGWNFFSEGWGEKGVCSWDRQHFGGSWDMQHFGGGAVMSGDPVNLRDLKGRGCQMIDLYPNKLIDAGVRYAVWNILCFSGKKFSEAAEVLATLQMGENAETGDVYEPSRAQMVFPLKSDSLTSFVAYIDLVRRKLVYMDAALPGRVRSASQNGTILSEKMPAYLEYLNALPSVHDLLDNALPGSLPVLYDDRNVELTDRAYVFRPENPNNSFQRMSISDFLGE